MKVKNWKASLTIEWETGRQEVHKFNNDMNGNYHSELAKIVKHLEKLATANEDKHKGGNYV